MDGRGLYSACAEASDSRCDPNAITRLMIKKLRQKRRRSAVLMVREPTADGSLIIAALHSIVSALNRKSEPWRAS